MKNTLLITFFCLLFCGFSLAQNRGSGNKVSGAQVFDDEKKLEPNFELLIGYLPSKEYEAVKAGVALNNFLLRRVGLYTTIEKGPHNNYFSNIIGGTISIHRNIYLYAGGDVFTDHGLIKNGLTHGRKEVGVDIAFLRFLTIRAAYSFRAGSTFGIGARIPL